MTKLRSGSETRAQVYYTIGIVALFPFYLFYPLPEPPSPPPFSSPLPPMPPYPPSYGSFEKLWKNVQLRHRQLHGASGLITWPSGHTRLWSLPPINIIFALSRAYALRRWPMPTDRTVGKGPVLCILWILLCHNLVNVHVIQFVTEG